jgi:hypothetical protein
MDHPSPAVRRSAHLRVGGAAIAAFLLFLAIGAARGPAQAQPIVPAATSTPAQPAQPGYRRHDRGGFGTSPDEGGPGFGQGPDEGGSGFGRGEGGEAQPAPAAPSTGGAQS